MRDPEPEYLCSSSSSRRYLIEIECWSTARKVIDVVIEARSGWWRLELGHHASLSRWSQIISVCGLSLPGEWGVQCRFKALNVAAKHTGRRNVVENDEEPVNHNHRIGLPNRQERGRWVPSAQGDCRKTRKTSSAHALMSPLLKITANRTSYA